MKNASKKITEALNIIRKFYAAVNVQRTESEDTVYLFDYSGNKKTIGSEKIAKAVEKAVKQQDFPKQVIYSEGMLTIPSLIQNEPVVIAEPETIAEEPELFTATETETEQPKKRRKKQSDAES